MKKLTAAGVVLATTVSVFTVSPAAPASAAGYVLGLFEHDTYGGTNKEFTCRANYYENLGALENQASSMVNDAYTGAWLYSKDNAAGTIYYAKPRSKDTDLTNNNFDNTVESLMFEDASRCNG